MRRGRRGRRIPWLPLRLHWRFCSFSGGGDFLNHHTSTLPPHIQNRDSRTTTHRKFSQATTTDPHQKPRCHISKSTQKRKPPHIHTDHHTSNSRTPKPPHIDNFLLKKYAAYEQIFIMGVLALSRSLHLPCPMPPAPARCALGSSVVQLTNKYFHVAMCFFLFPFLDH